jgi:ribonuclease E
MTKRMLIDATHPEETRVAVVSGTRLEDVDFEIAAKKPLKGNIYLAKVTRVEPSLQAAFVDYGGNRHGFLAFSEIHPDYYRIPVADREALLAEEARLGAEDEDEDDRGGRRSARRGRATPAVEPDALPAIASASAAATVAASIMPVETAGPPIVDEFAGQPSPGPEPQPESIALAETLAADLAVRAEQHAPAAAGEPDEMGEPTRGEVAEVVPGIEVAEIGGETVAVGDAAGGDELEETRRRRARQFRRYKIQEVVKRRQIMLVQVTKEERGNKGAALTTYLSLAGRYCVLMPNTPRGGGISRKITSANDRKRLKSIIDELDIPDGIAVIVRTAGSERSRAEIKRDYEYLLRLWDEIRELTLRSTAPALVYEEANLIKRAIRDLYSKDIADILVEGEEGYKSAKSFMKMLTPSHAKRVQLYKDATVPLFHRYQVESQIDAIHQPVVQLRSGGYIVLNQTEALVAIDVNSGRATRERHIEETALKTNLEASDVVARQLRLRDLAGLIVIDFIDMEDQRHNTQVERRLKEALKNDRARIQLGRISHFGLLEMSRQRLRPSLFEASTVVCRHCNGTGHMRSTESTALHILRGIEDEGIRNRSAEISVAAPTAVVLYILNQKRAMLAGIEQRYGFHVLLGADDNLIPPEYRLERMRARPAEDERAQPVIPDQPVEDEEEEVEEAQPRPAAEPREERVADDDAGQRRRRSRRRRRRRGGDEEAAPVPMQTRPMVAPAESEDGEEPDERAPATPVEAHAEGEAARKRRRRGKRGGRRRRRGPDGQPIAEPESAGVVSNMQVKAPIADAATPGDTAFDVDRDLAEGESWNRRERHPEPMEPPPATRPEPKAIPVPEPKHRDERPVFPEKQPSVIPQPVGEPAPDSQPRRRGWWQRVME